jgi:Beta-lactamase
VPLSAVEVSQHGPAHHRSDVVCDERTRDRCGEGVTGPADQPLDWMCASKPIIAYAALRVLVDAGRGVDTDLRPFLCTAPSCPPITLRHMLTYRSGLRRPTSGAHLACILDPPLGRAPEWNPETDAEYWNAGWELIPKLVHRLTGRDFGNYLIDDLLKAEFDVSGVCLTKGMSTVYRDRDAVRNDEIRRVFPPNDLATSLRGSLSEHCRLLAGLLTDERARK